MPEDTLDAVVVSEDALARRGLTAILSGHLAIAGAVGPEGLEELLGTVDAAVRIEDLDEDRVDPAPEVPRLRLVEDEEAARRALASGVRGVVRRDVSVGALVAAARAVAEGLVVVDPDWLDAVGGTPSGPSPLTAREMDVLELMAEGRTNADVALALGIGVNTVRYHVASLLEKLEADNRTDAVVRALRKGWLVL